MIEINNITRSRTDEKFVMQVAQKVLRKEKAERYNLSIAFIDAAEMRALHRKYRKKDKVANVLSFPAKEFGLGEIVICPAQVRKDAKKYGMMFREALAWMLIHGILHLLRYNHESGKEAKVMEKKERDYLGHARGNKL